MYVCSFNETKNVFFFLTTDLFERLSLSNKYIILIHICRCTYIQWTLENSNSLQIWISPSAILRFYIPIKVSVIWRPLEFELISRHFTSNFWRATVVCITVYTHLIHLVVVFLSFFSSIFPIFSLLKKKRVSIILLLLYKQQRYSECERD